jgi:hypothetical protein
LQRKPDNLYNVLNNYAFIETEKNFWKSSFRCHHIIIPFKNIFSMIVKLLMENLNLSHYERKFVECFKNIYFNRNDVKIVNHSDASAIFNKFKYDCLDAHKIINLREIDLHITKKQITLTKFYKN